MFELKIVVNRKEQISLFDGTNIPIVLAERVLLRQGNIVVQFLGGLYRKKKIADLFNERDFIIVSAGAIEASVALGVAIRLSGLNATMYLPSFFDRVPIWGYLGYLYNCILGLSCRFFVGIITINRVQAKIMRSLSGLPILVLPNKVRNVAQPRDQEKSRLIYIGRMDAQKRLTQLLNWLDDFSNPINEIVLFGDGPERKDLQALAKRLKYLKCRFQGWRDPEEQDQFIGRSDILLMNSIIEGEPLVVREARIRGMKVLVRNISGVKGVTLKRERFNSKSDLLEKLSLIANGTYPAANWAPNYDAARFNDQRENHLEILVNEILKAARSN